MKKLSRIEMKNVVGGKHLNCSHSCPTGQSTTGCNGCSSCSDVTGTGGVVTGLKKCVGDYCWETPCEAPANPQ